MVEISTLVLQVRGKMFMYLLGLCQYGMKTKEQVEIVNAFRIVSLRMLQFVK